MTSAVAQGAALPADSPPRLPLPPSQPAQIRSEAEALQVAAALAESFRGGAARRDSERLLPWDEIERYTASGLGGITVPFELRATSEATVVPQEPPPSRPTFNSRVRPFLPTQPLS